MPRVARLTCVWLGVALAAWLLPASIHIVDWTAAGPVRVAWFAPWWQLGIALIAAAIAVLIMAGRRRAAQSADAIVTPLALLWLWVIPYLPWIPDRAPALLMFAGPLRWGVLAVALAGSLAAALSRSPLRIDRLPGRRTVFVASFALYVGLGLLSASAVGPQADEPHYLIITQSLLRDHDLAIENNHARRDYAEYYGRDLRPDFLRRGLHEVIYSIHAPGLPALLVPAFAAAGYRGALVTVCLFGALTALAVFDLAAQMAGPAAALMTWAAVCLTVPFVPHSWLIFPEIPAALLMGWSALWLHAPLPVRVRTWIWRGAALAMLPWLHTKFVILLAAMGAALLLRLWRAPRAAVALITPIVVSAALWIYFFYRLYGELDPQAPYGDFPKLYVLAANIPRGVTGLLFDQKFGLLIYAPIYAIAVAGAWMMCRRPALRPLAASLIVAVTAFVASSARMYLWWGGSSAPARFLVPVLPLLAPMIAVAFDSWRSSAAGALSVLLLLVSLAIAGAGVVEPGRLLLFSAPHGLANMVSAAQGPAPLAYLLPTFTEALRAPLGLLMPWTIAAGAALAVLGLASRFAARRSSFAIAAFALVIFVTGGAVLAGPPVAAAQRRQTALDGRLALMRAFDGDALRGLDYARHAIVREPQLLAIGRIPLLRSAGELTDDPQHLVTPLDLPAGRFTAQVAFAADPGPETAAVTIGDSMPIARGMAATPLAFDLPFDAGIGVMMADATVAASAQKIEIAAESIVPRHARIPLVAHAFEPVAGRPGAYIVYADGDTYPEGGVFWTNATRAGRVYVAPAGATTLVLTLHVGAAAGTVRLVVDAVDHSLTLAPGQTQQIEIALTSGARLVPIVVEAPGRFRPSDQEPGSTDQRWLGCQVRIGLR